MGKRNWKHKRYAIPRDFAEVTDAVLLKACQSAKLPLVHRQNDDGTDRVWAPAWAAHAPKGTTAGMLRKARRDPDMRAAIIAATALAKPDTSLTIAGIDFGSGTDTTVVTGFAPGQFAPQVFARTRR